MLLIDRFWMMFVHTGFVWKQLQKLVGENILAFNPNFWTRLAARSDTCKSEDDKVYFWISDSISMDGFFTGLLLIFLLFFFLLFIVGMQKDYEELATSVMSLVDLMVLKTKVYLPLHFPDYCSMFCLFSLVLLWTIIVLLLTCFAGKDRVCNRCPEGNSKTCC